MMSNQLQCAFLVLVMLYNLNEHSSKRVPNEKTYKQAYHITVES